MEAAVLLRQQKALGEKHAKEVKTSADLFLRAAEMPPRKYKCSLAAYSLRRTDGPGRTLKKKKEHAGWKYWHLCSYTLRRLWEGFSGNDAGSIQLFGAGRRASTLRSRVLAARRYLNWLALNHDLGYPRELDHVTDYFLARQSEPCTTNALRGAHTAIAFMEEVAGVEQSEKLSGTQVVRKDPEGDPGQHASEQAGETGSKDAGWDDFDA